MLARMERWAILLLAPAAVDPEVWNRRLLDLCCELAAAVGVEELAVHLRDEPARAVAAPDATGAATFQALVELGGDPRAQAAVAALRDLGGPHVYRVESRRVKAYPRTWPDGARTPGVELLAALRRSPALSHEAFDAHWREVHAPPALRRHPGLWEYRQNAVLGVETPGSPDFDGIAVLGFPNAEECGSRPDASPEGRAAVLADLASFLDLSRSESTVTGEYLLRS
jgi:uncharacterized protein (TIGR02118 family)